MSVKIKPEIKERWLAALRSGEYKQCQNYLLDRGRYCCLGVLCDLASQEGVVSNNNEKNDWAMLEGDYPSMEVLDWAVDGEYSLNPAEDWKCGLTKPPKYVAEDYEAYEDSPLYTLDNKNDKGYTFEELADIIEEKF